MIKNERQYRITKAQAQKIEQALVQLTRYPEETKKENLLLWEAQKSALESQLNDLREEIQEYEALTTKVDFELS